MNISESYVTLSKYGAGDMKGVWDLARITEIHSARPIETTLSAYGITVVDVAKTEHPYVWLFNSDEQEMLLFDRETGSWYCYCRCPKSKYDSIARFFIIEVIEDEYGFTLHLAADYTS